MRESPYAEISYADCRFGRKFVALKLKFERRHVSTKILRAVRHAADTLPRGYRLRHIRGGQLASGCSGRGILRGSGDMEDQVLIIRWEDNGKFREEERLKIGDDAREIVSDQYSSPELISAERDRR